MKPKILLALKLNKEYYVNAVNASGGEAHAFYCPTLSTDYDGLISCGGVDINPKIYGEEINGAKDIDDARDTAELALIDAFVKAKKPILGICRGSQLLNVYFGGTLIQDLPNKQFHTSTKGTDGQSIYASHPVEVVKDCFLSDIYGKTFNINSSHHQAVKDLGKGLEIIAYHDGVVEAFMHKELPIIAMQWHPEYTCTATPEENVVDGYKIFEFFINMCKEHKSKQ